MVTRRHFTVGGLAAVTAACHRKAYKAFDGFAFVANGEGKSVAVVDLSSFSVSHQIALNAEARQILAHPSGSSVYTLTNEGVSQLSPKTFSSKAEIRLKSSPFSMRLSPDGTLLWVIGADRRLTALDAGTLKHVRDMALPAEPSDFDLSRETGLAAVSFASAGSVTQIDLASGRVGTLTHIADRVGTLRYRKDGKTLLVANTSGRMLTVLESGTGQVVTHLPLAVRPDHFCFNRDEGQLFITGEGRDAVVVVYPYYIPQVAETVLAGHAPGAMTVSDTLLFLANPVTGNLSIMNIERRKVIAVTSVGVEPSQIALTPGDDYVLVLNHGSGDMAVLRMKAVAPNALAETFGNSRKSAGLFWMVPVGSKPVGMAVVRA